MASPMPYDNRRPASASTGAATDARHFAGVFGAFVFACLLSFAAYPGAWASMAHVWWTSDTFAHGFIALPCAAWMIWRRRADWAAVQLRTWWPALAATLGCGALWLAGRLGGVASIEQLAAVSTIPATLLLLAGPAIGRMLVFPLAFLFFAVPIGDFLTPVMMDYTADATIAALRWTGIPVYREGLHFTLPTGRWSVVEACSGLRYLIASLALGVLYAYLQFRTLRYRLAFIALAIAMPIVANWIRAYIIVLLGHLSDMKIATGADHLVYGWLFFGVVMALMFWIGSRWREPAAPEKPQADRTSVARAATGRASRGAVIAAIMAAFAALAWRPVAGSMLDATQPIRIADAIVAALDRFADATALPFVPSYAGAVEVVRASRAIAGQAVDTHVFYYARQHESQEMIHARNALVHNRDRQWAIRSRSARSTGFGAVETFRIGRGGETLLVWHWYAVGGHQTASAYRAKAATTWRLATGRGDHSLAVALATPLGDGGSEAVQAAEQRLATAATALAPALDAMSRGRMPQRSGR